MADSIEQDFERLNNLPDDAARRRSRQTQRNAAHSAGIQKSVPRSPDDRIASRREGLRSGAIDSTRMVVPGSYHLLDTLQSHGCCLFLASGTDEVQVRAEVALGRLDRYFHNHIYGA